jgi:hypothetical protein
MIDNLEQIKSYLKEEEVVAFLYAEDQEEVDFDLMKL